MPNDVDLSEREREILRLVATGASNKEIAQKLVISPNTVKVHLRNIFAKIGVMSRTEATLYAIREGLVAHPAGSATEAVNQPNGVAVSIEPPTGFAAAWERLGRFRWLVVAALALIILAAGGLVGLLLVRSGGTTSGLPANANAPTLAPRWQARAPLPEARSGLAAAVYENRIYAIAGETAQGVSGAVSVFDPQKNAWSAAAGKPTPVSDVGAALIGEKIYVPGGKLASGQPTDKMEVFDPRRDVWETGTPLPAPRSAYALATFEGRLYLFGGWDGTKAVATVFEFDPESGDWRERTPLPSARMFAGAVEAAGKILVVGGTDGTKALADVWAYYPGRDASGDRPWEQRAALPAARYAMGIASLADTVYVVGGQGSVAPVEYLAAADQWAAFEAPKESPGWDLALAAVGNFIYVIGGREGQEVLGEVEGYQAMYTIAIPVISK